MPGSLASFNEAAGIPRGRLESILVAIVETIEASMRPRVFPAEDVRRGPNERSHRRHASMRPRVFPAEDDGCSRCCNGVQCAASMRPRVFPAEDEAAKAARKAADELQ